MEHEKKKWNYKVDIKMNLEIEFPKNTALDDVESEILDYLEEFKVFLEGKEITDKKVFLVDLYEEEN